MRVKKLCALLLIAVLVSAFQMPAVFAAEEVVVFSDFEDCTDTIKEPWRAQGHSTTASVEQTERGMSAVLETLPGKMEEVFCDYPETDNSVQAVVMRYAMKVCDTNVNRSLYTRNKSGEFGLVSFFSGGSVNIGDTQIPDITIVPDVWYDIFVIYLPVTGEVRLTINDGESIKTAIANCKNSGKTGLYRINFAAFSTATKGSKAYIDDVSVHTLDYVPDNFTGSSYEFHDFEDYTATDGATPPKGWRLQNLGSGSASGKSIDSDDGKAIECRTNGSTHFELVKWFDSAIAGEGSIEADFKREENSGVWMAMRAYDSSDKEIKPNVFSMKMDKDGNVKVDGKTLGTLKAGVWYRLGYHFNTDNQTYTFTATSDDESFSVESTFPDTYKKIAAFEFYTPTSIGASAFVVDNVAIGAKEEFGISAVNPNFESVSAFTDRIEISCVGNKSDVASNASFALNGDSSYFDGYTEEGNKIILNLAKPLDYGKLYLLEALNLGDEENSASIIASFLTERQFSYNNYKITSESDMLTATISAKSSDGETHKITLLLAIYNKETGEMIDLTATESNFGDESADLSVSLSHPAEAGEYEAYAYVWDGADTMQSLIAPKIFNIE